MFAFLSSMFIKNELNLIDIFIVCKKKNTE